MIPGRNMSAALNGSRMRAFSVRPLTRPHIVRPFSVLSVPWPDTYTKVMAGLIRLTVSATDIVRLYVTLV